MRPSEEKHFIRNMQLCLKSQYSSTTSDHSKKMTYQTFYRYFSLKTNIILIKRGERAVHYPIVCHVSQQSLIDFKTRQEANIPNSHNFLHSEKTYVCTNLTFAGHCWSLESASDDWGQPAQCGGRGEHLLPGVGG